MNDEFLDQLRTEWRSQPDVMSATLAGLKKARWAPQVGLGLEMVAYAIALATGVWFAWVAMQSEQHRVIFGLSACVLLVAAPALSIAAIMARRSGLAWDAETPESLLRTGVRRADASLRAITLGWLHIGISGVFFVALWIAELLGFMHERGFLVFYTAFCAAASVVAALWLLWRARRLRRERSACLRLLAELQVEASPRSDFAGGV